MKGTASQKLILSENSAKFAMRRWLKPNGCTKIWYGCNATHTQISTLMVQSFYLWIAQFQCLFYFDLFRMMLKFLLKSCKRYLHKNKATKNNLSLSCMTLVVLYKICMNVPWMCHWNNASSAALSQISYKCFYPQVASLSVLVWWRPKTSWNWTHGKC